MPYYDCTCIYFILIGIYGEYECNYPLMEKAALKATSSLRDRGPENAILHGKW